MKWGSVETLTSDEDNIYYSRLEEDSGTDYNVVSSMLCTMKGRDENGYPLEGEDVVPERPKPSPVEQDAIPRLVKLLQEANRRLDNTIEALEASNRKYDHLHKEYVALKYSDFCETCQMKKDSTPKGGCVELCRKCSVGRQTIESLKLQLVKEEERSQFWHECYETALRERYESDIPLSQP